MRCKHLRDTCGEPRADAYGFIPSPGVCAVCPHYEGKARGLGDIVETVTRVTGIKRALRVIRPAGCGCAQRRSEMNARFPLK